MATATEIPAIPVPPVEPPRPQGVTLQMTWDEFLLLHAAVGDTNLSTNRERVRSNASTYARDSRRPRSHLMLSTTNERTANLSSIYSQLHKVLVNNA